MTKECRHCSLVFTVLPGKKGFINECPDCVEERYSPKPQTVSEPVGVAHAVKPRVRRPISPERSERLLRTSLRDMLVMLAKIERITR